MTRSSVKEVYVAAKIDDLIECCTHRIYFKREYTKKRELDLLGVR